MGRYCGATAESGNFFLSKAMVAAEERMASGSIAAKSTAFLPSIRENHSYIRPDGQLYFKNLSSLSFECGGRRDGKL